MHWKDYSYFIHNHLSFLVKYNRDAHTGLARIVGFEVKPFRKVVSRGHHAGTLTLTLLTIIGLPLGILL
jgi:hypothetical protein